MERTPALLEERVFRRLDRIPLLQGGNLQGWPTFLGPGPRRELIHAMRGLGALVRSLPERWFEGDSGRMAEFYGLSPTERRLVEAALASPRGTSDVVSRGDFCDTKDGVRLIELNMGGNLGGWQSGLWIRLLLQIPEMAAFFRQCEIRVKVRDTLRQYFRHLLSGETRIPTVLLLVKPGFRNATMREFLTRRFRETAREMGLEGEGEVLLGTYDELEAEGDRLSFDGRRVDRLAEQNPVRYDERIEAALRSSTVRFYNGPLHRILGDKRNLALVWEALEAGLLETEEEALVRRHLPRTFRVAPGPVRWDGRDVDLPTLLVDRRDRFVLKPATEYGGLGVMIGPHTSGTAWEQGLERALDDGAWVAQEHLTASEYAYRHGSRGWRLCAVVWGVFHFGKIYGGTFVRMQPSGGSGVINSARGALNGLVLEAER